MRAIETRKEHKVAGRNLLPISIVVLVGLVSASPLFSGFPPFTIDGSIHVKWAHHAAIQFWSGSLYPRYFPELNNDFGSPSFFYYPPLSTFAAALIWPIAPEHNRAWYALGWSAAVGLILSGIAMWGFLQHCIGHRWPAVLGALLYVIAPYHLGVDLLDRGANAECWAFVFMPLVLWSFRHLSIESLICRGPTAASNRVMTSCALPSTHTILSAISLSALFCCHVLTAITFGVIAFGYACFLGLPTLRRAVAAGVWSLLLSAMYLLPAATYSDYICGSSDDFFMGRLFRQTFFFPNLQLRQPLFTNDAYHQRLLVVFIGMWVVQIVCIVSLLLRVIPEKKRRVMMVLVAGLLFCLTMMLPISEPLYVLLPALQRLQFPWRFLSPATFICSIMIGVLATSPIKLSVGSYMVLSFALAAFILPAVYVNYGLYGRTLLTEEGTWRKKVPSIEFNSRDAFGEYVPTGASIPASEDFFRNATNVGPSAFVLLSGIGQVTLERRTSRYLLIEANSEDGLRLLLHQFWFPGWLANDLESGEIISVDRHSDSGLMVLSIPKGHRRIGLRLSLLWPEATGLLLSALSATWFSGLTVWRICGRKTLHAITSDQSLGLRVGH